MKLMRAIRLLIEKAIRKKNPINKEKAK